MSIKATRSEGHRRERQWSTESKTILRISVLLRPSRAENQRRQGKSPLLEQLPSTQGDKQSLWDKEVVSLPKLADLSTNALNSCEGSSPSGRQEALRKLEDSTKTNRTSPIGTKRLD